MHILYWYFKSAVSLLSVKPVCRCLCLSICSECSFGSPSFFILTRTHQYLLFISRWWDIIYLFQVLVLLRISPRTSVHYITVPCFLHLPWDVKRSCLCLPSGDNWRITKSSKWNIATNIVNGLWQSSKSLWRALGMDVFLFLKSTNVR